MEDKEHSFSELVGWIICNTGIPANVNPNQIWIQGCKSGCYGCACSEMTIEAGEADVKILTYREDFNGDPCWPGFREKILKLYHHIPPNRIERKKGEALYQLSNGTNWKLYGTYSFKVDWVSERGCLSSYVIKLWLLNTVFNSSSFSSRLLIDLIPSFKKKLFLVLMTGHKGETYTSRFGSRYGHRLNPIIISDQYY